MQAAAQALRRGGCRSRSHSSATQRPHVPASRSAPLSPCWKPIPPSPSSDPARRFPAPPPTGTGAGGRDREDDVRCDRTTSPRGPGVGRRLSASEAIALLTLDLHPIFRNNRDIDIALRQTLFKAAATGIDVVQIIPGKGTGQLKKRVLAVLAQKHIKKLYVRVETDATNAGRILVHLR
ncbi:Smr/MutS family protein [Streptomyces mirabilis]|uniref:Smr/MutS family protein n=1 Tax=Streptomyces mirabilis TaxID=68239 RepID=UPI0036334D36